MGQNGSGHNEIDEIARFFACWTKSMEIKSVLKNIWMGVVKN